MVTLYHYLILSAILFSIGLVGVLTRRNIIVIMMSLELMLNSAGLNLIAFSKYLNNMDGHVFTMMLMTVAAAEAAIGLAILISIFNNKPTINVDDWNSMKW